MAAQPAWRSGASAIAQVITVTLGGTWEVDDIVIITLTDEYGATQSLNVTTGSTNTTTIATTVTTAFNLSTKTFFTPITCTGGAGTLTFTADTAGVAFYLAVTSTEANGGAADSQTITHAETQVNSGPNDFNTLLNWTTGAAPVAQVDILTVAGTWEADDLAVITLSYPDGTTQTLSVTSGSTNTTTIASTIATAFNASTLTLFSRITASPSTNTVTLTADTAGIPFYCSVTTTEANGSAADSQTFTRAASVANTGIPTTSDTMTLDGRGGSTSATGILYGLRQSAATVTAIRHYKSAPPIGTITAPLAIGWTTADWGLPPNDGSSPSGQLVNATPGTVASTTNVYDSLNTGSSGLAPILLGGNNASNVFNQYGGIVGIGTFVPGTTCTFSAINVVKGVLTTGSAVDFTTTTVNGGRVTLGKGSSSGTLVSNGGDTTVNGGTKIGTVTGNGGTVHYNPRISGDDVGTVTMNGMEFDVSGAAAVINATALAITKGGKVRVASAAQFTATTTTFDVTNGVNLQMLVAA